VHDLLKVRPDVLSLDREICRGTWATYRRDPSLWYLHRLRRHGVNVPMSLPHDPARWQYLAEDGYLIDLLQGPLRSRPICITFFGTGAPADRDRQVFFHWAAARYRPLPVGIILRLHPKDRPVNLPALIRDNERQWAQMTLPDLSHARTDDELDPDYVSNHYACSLVNFGGLHEMAGNVSRAEALYRVACEWAPGYAGASQALAAVRTNRNGRRRQPSPAG
jgi:hypothetical protein